MSEARLRDRGADPGGAEAKTELLRHQHTSLSSSSSTV